MTAISVDVGTTLIKVVGYDDDGAEIVIVRRPTTVHHPAPDWAEQDMTEVWSVVTASVRTVVEQLAGPVGYLAITAQGDGCWLVDADGHPTGPAILWNDGRAAAIVTDWAERGILDQAFRTNGSMTFAGLPNAILTWLRRHQPDRLARSATALTCGGWVFAQLTGEITVDDSDASAPFLDIRTRRYSRELFDLYDMRWAEPLLPLPRSDGQRVAALSTEAAETVGLPAGTAVVLCPYDVASTAIGAGAVSDGQACTILGTTLCTEVVTSQPDPGSGGAGLTIAFGAPQQYLRAFPTLAGGEVIQWACDLLELDQPAQLTQLATQTPPGADGLVFLPYLSPAGERAPFLDPLARGTLFGLSLRHRRPHIARAVLEGLSLVIADCLAASAAKPSELRVCGGGSVSGGWLQIIADVTGLPLLKSTDTEVGARGAFLVGLVATGGTSSIKDAAERYVRNQATYAPDPSRANSYAGMLRDFLSLRGSLSGAGPLLADPRLRAARVGQDPK
ncbi:FGGY-family carbohydrate kinase [Pseudofrankia sp. BMG5.36]|uniref:FGGY-family carbohydrate kinase n=1 Tax=Pseudofrankia sp. BMG5.36 TaxID=1834512 RepID=UPI0008D9679B|nr:FGGY-family carbohydrate kinase [Pseudofrankia sp. BMG5.36]OHV43454.1 carbohydrate kinase [Pseudofrankia sp. BMG5.36]